MSIARLIPVICLLVAGPARAQINGDDPLAPLPDALHLSFEHQPSGVEVQWIVEGPAPGPQEVKRIELPEGGVFEVGTTLEPLHSSSVGTVVTVEFAVHAVVKKRKKERRELVMQPKVAALAGNQARVSQGSGETSITLSARYEPWAGVVYAEGDAVVACQVAGEIRDGYDCPFGRARSVGTIPPQPGPMALPVGSGSVFVDPDSGEPCPDNRTFTVAAVDERALGRAIEEFPLDHARYRELIGEALGLPDVTLGQLMRLDLEGDGVDEVLFAADSHRGERPMTDENGSPKYDTYSVVGLRKVVGEGQVATIVAWEHRGTVDWEKGFPELAAGTLAGFTDIDGDGTLEIIVSSNGYEWWDTALYRVEGSEAVRLAGAGCAI